jgi:hypothetical protein
LKLGLTIIYRLLYIVETVVLIGGTGFAIGLGFEEGNIWLFAILSFSTFVLMGIVHFVFTLPIANALEQDDFLANIWKRISSRSKLVREAKLGLAVRVKVAAWMWIAIGILFIISGFVLAVSTVNSTDSYNILIGLLVAFITLAFGSFFLYAGRSTLTISAKDVLGNGLGSIAFSIFGIAPGLQSLESGRIAEAIGALIPTVVLFVSGVVVLIGRGEYKKALERKKAGLVSES